MLTKERRDDARRLVHGLQESEPGLLLTAFATAARLANADVSLEWEKPQWAPERLWCRPVILTVNLSRGKDTSSAEHRLLVPWPVDAGAASTAPTGVVVGGGAGTHWGRPREHPIRLVRTAGVRFVHWDDASKDDGTAHALEIVPGWGPQLRVTASTKGTVLRLAARGVRVPKSQRSYTTTTLRPRLPSDRTSLVARRDGLAPRSETERVPLTEYLASLAPAMAVDDAALASSLGLLATHLPALAPSLATDDGTGLPPTALWRRPDVLTTLVAALARRSAPFVPLLDRAGWHEEHLHSQLAREVHRGAVRMLSDLSGTRLNAETVAAVLATSLARAVDSVVAGRNEHVGGALMDAPTNSVAAVERARTVTFFGPAGLEDYRGRLDLRVLPEEWSGRLCPVQTPESEKVGLVRFRALGDAVAEEGRGPEVPRDLAEFSVGASLIPYVDHDDPTRASIAAKMMRQAVRVRAAEPPRIRSGAEEWLAEQVGVVRSPQAGIVERVDPGLIVVAETPLAFGPAEHDGRGSEARWHALVEVGEWVDEGQIVAHAPDVRFDLSGDGPGRACLALGVDALVGVVAWKGWNFEDGIVVSRSFSERLGSEDRVRIDVPAGEDTIVEDLLTPEHLEGGRLQKGAELFAVSTVSGDRRVYRMPHTGYVSPSSSSDGARRGVTRSGGRAGIDVIALRPLAVGDKLTTRHGGKGIVSRIERDENMPTYTDGRPLEVLLNPLGIIRRLNAGTLLELSSGLVAESTGSAVTAPRSVGQDARLELAQSVGPEHASVGILHMLKLDHLAAAKAAGRADTGASPVTFQPVRASTWGEDRREGAPQRIGEMEMWGLLASGADGVLADLLRARGEGERSARGDARLLPAGLRAACAHLAIGAVHLEARLAPAGSDHDETWVDITVDPRVDRSRVRELRARFREADDTPPTWSSIISHHRESALADSAPLDYLKAAREARSAIAALLEGTDDTDDLDSPPEERTRRYIPLSAPVRHPWWPRRRLHWIAVPSARLLRTPQGIDPRRQSLRRGIEGVLTVELILRSFGVGGKRSRYRQRLEAELERRVGELLGDPANPAPSSIAGRLQGKYGVLRRNLLGASAIRSARAVLAGHPGLDVERVELPRWMLAQLGVPVDVPIEQRGEFDDVVLVNRQPTLLPYTLIALRAVEGEHDVVRIHPHHVTALAGDFDGDTIAVHRPITEAERRDTWSARRPAAALRSASAGELIAPLGLDVALGASIATKDRDARRGFAERLAARLASHVQPRAVTALTEPMIATAIGDEALDTPERVTQAAERLAALHGEDSVQRRRLSLEVLVAFEAECFESASEWRVAVLSLPTGSVAAALESNADFARAVRAGVLGKPSDLEQLLVRRGAIALPTAIQQGGEVDGCYLDGLDSRGYARAARGALSSLAAKKLVTPFAGALTRELVTLGFEEVVTTADCGQAPGHDVLECPDGKLCARAYGHDRETGGEIQIGRRVGILAGMVIGERSTQLAMKSIHQREGSAGALSSTVTDVGALLTELGRLHDSVMVDDDGGDVEELLRLDHDVATRRLRDRAHAVVKLLGGSVDLVHPLLLMRLHLRAGERLDAAKNSEPPQTLAVSRRDGWKTPRPRELSRFADAVTEGDLRLLLPEQDDTVTFEPQVDPPAHEPTLIGIVAGSLHAGDSDHE